MYRPGLVSPDLKNRLPDDSKWHGLDHCWQFGYLDDHKPSTPRDGWESLSDVAGDDPIYREWSWEIFKAFEKHTKVDDDEGYMSLNNGTKVPSMCRDNIKSFWLVSLKVICVEWVVRLNTLSRPRHWNIFIFCSPLETSFRLLRWFSTLKHMCCLSSTRRGSKPDWEGRQRGWCAGCIASTPVVMISHYLAVSWDSCPTMKQQEDKLQPVCTGGTPFKGSSEDPLTFLLIWYWLGIVLSLWEFLLEINPLVSDHWGDIGCVRHNKSLFMEITVVLACMV